MRRGRPHLRRTRLALATAALPILVPPAATAAAGTGYSDRTPLPRGVSDPAPAAVTHSAIDGGTVLRTVVGLVVVIGVVYGLYWLLRAYTRSKGARSDGRMDVVATTALGPTRALHLVRVGDELVLVGSSENAVTGIRVYQADDADRLGDLLGGDGLIRGGKRQTGAGPGGWSAFFDELRRKTART